VAWGAGPAAAWALAGAAVRTRRGRVFAADEMDGEAAGGEAVAAGAVAVLLAAFCAGAVRANRAAKPTAATALSWVARQVRRERRRRPAARAAPGGPAGNSDVSCMTGDHSRLVVKSS